MKIAKKLVHPQVVSELVPANYMLKVIADFPNSAHVTEISRWNGEPKSPVMVSDPDGFTSLRYADLDRDFRIEALTDHPIYYAIIDKEQPLVLETDEVLIGVSR